SRVGPQLAGALIFIFLTASFYSYLAPRLTGFDVYSATFRSNVSPLNTPADPHLIAVVREASTSSFHLAMLIGVVLLLAGAIVNAVGIRNAQAKKADVAVESGTAGELAGGREYEVLARRLEVGGKPAALSL